MGPAAAADDGGDDDGDAIVLASSVMPGVIGATLPGCGPGRHSGSPASARDGNSPVLQVPQGVTPRGDTEGVTPRG